MNSGNDIDQATFLGGLRRGELASDHFTIVSNLVARDRTISFKAKGLFLNLASHRDDFTITEEFLATQATDGVKAIRGMLHELRAAGYLYRGEQVRYPKGTRNAKGKDISGARGPYQWYVTDKPKEVAKILEQYAAEHRDEGHEPAGQDNDPKRPAVPASDDADGDGPVDNSGSTANQGAETAGCDDQAEQGETADHHNRPEPTVDYRSTKEDQDQKTSEGEDQEEPSLSSGSSHEETFHPSIKSPNADDDIENSDDPASEATSPTPDRWMDGDDSIRGNHHGGTQEAHTAPRLTESAATLSKAENATQRHNVPGKTTSSALISELERRHSAHLTGRRDEYVATVNVALTVLPEWEVRSILGDGLDQAGRPAGALVQRVRSLPAVCEERQREHAVAAERRQRAACDSEQWRAAADEDSPIRTAAQASIRAIIGSPRPASRRRREM